MTCKDNGTPNKNPLDSNINNLSYSIVYRCFANISITYCRVYGFPDIGNISKKFNPGFGKSL